LNEEDLPEFRLDSACAPGDYLAATMKRDRQDQLIEVSMFSGKSPGYDLLS
jgi:hypothetical protein